MSESLPNHSSAEAPNKQELKSRFISLAKELANKPEGFPFPGVDEDTFKSLKAADEEYPGYTTPVGEIITRMQGEGIKIVLGEDPESGNVFALPLSSDDVGKDSLLPRHLNTVLEMDASLQTLILAQKSLFESEQPED